MPIDPQKPLTIARSEFETKISTLTESFKKAHIYIETMRWQIIDSSIYLQIATDSLPTLLQWCTHLNVQLPEDTVITRREIFLAYLTQAIVSREQEIKLQGVDVPKNLKEKVIDYLLNLTHEMLVHNGKKVYEMNAQQVHLTEEMKQQILNDAPQNPPGGSWATIFFGDPWQGTQPKNLRILTLIRECAQDVLQLVDEKWRFIEPDFLYQIDSCNVVELTAICSTLSTKGKNARKEGISIFATALFKEPKGPFIFRKDQSSATATVFTYPRNYQLVLFDKKCDLITSSKLLARCDFAITLEELNQIPNSKEIFFLSQEARKQLIENIQSYRSELDEPAEYNYFLIGLKALLSNGVVLKDIAKLCKEKQRLYVTLYHSSVVLLLKNGIEFNLIAGVDTHQLEDILRGIGSEGKYVLATESPKKSAYVEQIRAVFLNQLQAVNDTLTPPVSM